MSTKLQTISPAFAMNHRTTKGRHSIFQAVDVKIPIGPSSNDENPYIFINLNVPGYNVKSVRKIGRLVLIQLALESFAESLPRRRIRAIIDLKKGGNKKKKTSNFEINLRSLLEKCC